MDAKIFCSGILLIGLAAAAAGCRGPADGRFHDSDAHYESVITRIEYPDVDLDHRRP